DPDGAVDGGRSGEPAVAAERHAGVGPAVPLPRSVQPQARELGAHALDGELTQLGGGAVGDPHFPRLAHAVHRPPPPAGVAGLLNSDNQPSPAATMNLPR